MDNQLLEIIATCAAQAIQRRNDPTVAITDAYAAAEAWHKQEVERKLSDQVATYKSFCGCPMCLYHVEAYRLAEQRKELNNG